jgi:hypothetical protein
MSEEILNPIPVLEEVKEVAKIKKPRSELQLQAFKMARQKRDENTLKRKLEKEQIVAAEQPIPENKIIEPETKKIKKPRKKKEEEDCVIF